MQNAPPPLQGILEEVGWEYSAGATLDPLDILERERKRLDLRRRARTAPIELPRAVADCVDRFLAVEFDLNHPQARGLGRMTDQIPRLAARHRQRLRKLPSSERGLLREHVRNHMLCGYLFWSLGARPETKTDEPTSIEADQLFRAWIPLIYAPKGSELVDSARASSGLSEKDQGVWSNASERGVSLMLRAFAIEPDELDQIILCHYFHAGMLLSLLETGTIDQAEPLPSGQEPVEEDSVPEELFQIDRPHVSPIYVAFNGSLMAWVAIVFINQYLNMAI